MKHCLQKLDCRKPRTVISERRATNRVISTITPDFCLEAVHGPWTERRVTPKNRASLLTQKTEIRASLVAQWLRVPLPMQGARVQALFREDPTCCRATGPVRHKYWACALEPTSHNYWSLHAWSLCSTTREATAMRSPCTTTKSGCRSPQLEEAHVQQQRHNTAKNKQN